MRAVGVAIFLLAGCFGPEAQTCANVTCPSNLVCAPDGLRCVLPEQFEACRLLDENAACSVSDVGGICKSGLCELFTCGDGVRNGNEVCDGTDLGGTDCRTFGYANPDGLACRSDCKFDSDACGDSIQLVAYGFGETQDNFLSYGITVPPGEGLFLLVAVQVSSLCSGSADNVTVSLVEHANRFFTPVTSIVGTPCNGSSTTRSELWMLTAPTVTATEEIRVTLSPVPNSPPVHSAAFVFSGVNQVNPIRATAQTKGSGTSASVEVTSAPHDFVVDVVGHGFAIDAPAAGQSAIYIRNTSSDWTLDNTAASWHVGQGPTVTMGWTFAAPNEWQLIAASLQPR